MNRKVLKDELIRDEGVRLKAYLDTAGLWTIGVGHLLGERERMIEITMTEAIALLESDIDEALKVAYQFAPNLFPSELSDTISQDIRARALVNMAFNLGSRLNQFIHTRALLRSDQWAEAAKAMLDSKWATQVGPRALRIARLIETGQEQP